jgi:hypothetical protein
MYYDTPPPAVEKTTNESTTHDNDESESESNSFTIEIPTTKTTNNNTTPSRLQKKIMRKQLTVQTAHDEVDAVQKKVQSLERERTKIRLPMSEEEYNHANQVVVQVRDDICRELAKHIQERHAQLIEQYQTLDAKTGEYLYICYLLYLWTALEIGYIWLFL